MAGDGTSHLNDMADILKGDRAAQGQASGLNQLSDAAEKIAVGPDAQRMRNAPGGSLPPGPSTLPSQGFSQEQLIEAPQGLHFQQPSQPDIPPPIIPESQNPSQPGGMDADAARGLPPGAVLPPGAAALGAAVDPNMLNMMSNLVNAGMNLENFGSIYNPYALAGLPTGTEDDLNPIGSGGGSGRKGKKQTRRGPMDEMRQLIRILVKVFPHSVSLIGVNEEAGGGNRISEDQIKNYIERTLGDAPKPQWGVPTGWNGYLAELFSWATGKVVTGEECKQVAKREPGRSWEAMESELHALGVHPNCWPLPLTLTGVRKAEEKPVPIDIPAVPTVKRAAAPEDGGAAAGGERGSERATAGGGTSSRVRSRIERDLQKLDEADLWKLAGDAMTAAMGKTGTGGDQNAVMAARGAAKTRLDEAYNSAAASAAAAAAAAGAAGSYNHGAAGSMLQYIPVMNLDSSGILNLIHNGTGASFDPNDPAQAAALAALAAQAAGTDAGAAGVPPAKRQRQEGSPDEAAKNAAAAAAAGAQLGTLPMQPPPLNVPNFNGIPGSAALAAAAYMQFPHLNLGTLPPGGMPGMPGAGGPGDGEEIQPKSE